MSMQRPVFKPDDEIPSNVCREDQLESLPEECLSGDSDRPLRHVDEDGNVFHYSLSPMTYSVLLILIVELMERFSFYGIYYTLTMYLTGVYNDEWNANFKSVEAASYVSISTAVAYTTPFLGAILSDTWLGDYKSIVFGVVFLYLPGLVLVLLTTVPHLLGPEFNTRVLSIAVLVLWPMGTGVVKSVVNVFGARQFHPFLQSSLIESYFAAFYASINVGSLVGISIVPLLAQRHVTLAYAVPVAMLTSAVILFLSGTSRYVIAKPAHNLFQQQRKQVSDSSVSLATMFRISLLIVPFCMAYSQMPTVYILQGSVMERAFDGVVDAATINCVDTLSVLLVGRTVGRVGR
jgi:POT family proton-dependent oligopeptide transporter